MNQRLILGMILTMVWVGLTFNLSPSNIIFGAGISAMIVCFISPRALPAQGMTYRAVPLLNLCKFLIKEIIVSTMQVSKLVLADQQLLSSSMITYNLNVRGQGQVALLAQMITLTPGTLSVAYADNEDKLLVHVLQADEKHQVVRQIKQGLEKHVENSLLRTYVSPTLKEES